MATPTLLTDAQLARQTFFLDTVQSAVIHAAIAVASEVANDVQTLSETQGTATGGTFTLTWNGQVTAAIPFNAAAGQVQLALTALSNIGAGNIVCTGGPVPGTPIVATFCGTLGNVPQNAITVQNSLTGTGTPAYGITHTTVGVAAVNHAARQALASKILANPSGYAALMAPGVADNTTVQTDYPPPNFTLAAGVTQATADNDVQFQVNSIFGAYT